LVAADPKTQASIGRAGRRQGAGVVGWKSSSKWPRRRSAGPTSTVPDTAARKAFQIVPSPSLPHRPTRLQMSPGHTSRWLGWQSRRHNFRRVGEA